MSQDEIDNEGVITTTRETFNPFGKSDGGERAVDASMMSARENTEVL